MDRSLLLVALLPLMSSGLAEACWSTRYFAYGKKPTLRVQTSCWNGVAACNGLKSKCSPPGIDPYAESLLDEVIELYRTYKEAMPSLERAADSKAELDKGTAFMVRQAREQFDRQRNYVTNTVWPGDRYNMSKKMEPLRKEFAKVGEFMKAATPGLAKSESKEQAKARVEHEAESELRKAQKAKALASGVALAEIPTVGKMDLGKGLPPQPGGGPRRDVYKRDEQKADLVALRETRPVESRGRAPAAFTSGSPSPSSAALGLESPLTQRSVAATGPPGGLPRNGAPVEESATGEQGPEEKEAAESHKLPGVAQKLIDKAWELIMAGDYAAAEEAAKRALEFDPTNAAALEVLALAQVKLGKYEDAIRSASTAIELDPGRAGAFAYRAYAKELLGDRLGALADMEAAARLDPRYAERFRLAKAGGKLYDPDRADPLRGPSRRWLYVLVGGALAGIGGMAAWKLRERRRRGVAAPRSAGSAAASAPLAASAPRPGAALALKSLVGTAQPWQGLGEAGGSEAVDPSRSLRASVRKLPRAAGAAAPSKEALAAQARASMGAGSPLLLDVYDLVEAGDDLYLVYERADGQTVREQLVCWERLEPRWTVNILRQATQALEFALSRGSAYRQLAPEDMLLALDDRVRLLPCALSAARDPSVARFYRAPDFTGQACSDPQAAVFSLGVCLYEMLVGQRPFKEPGEVLQMKCAMPSARVHGLPEALNEVFLRAVQPDPELRIKTAGEFRNRLLTAVPPPGPGSGPPGPGSGPPAQASTQGAKGSLPAAPQ